MRHIWVTCMNLDTQWTLRWKSYGFWSEIKHLHFNEHFSIINTSLTTIPKMTWILFDITNLDNVGYHKLFHKWSSVDISLPQLLGHLHDKLAKPCSNSRSPHQFLQCWSKAVWPCVNHSLDLKRELQPTEKFAIIRPKLLPPICSYIWLTRE